MYIVPQSAAVEYSLGNHRNAFLVDLSISSVQSNAERNDNISAEMRICWNSHRERERAGTLHFVAEMWRVMLFYQTRWRVEYLNRCGLLICHFHSTSRYSVRKTCALIKVFESPLKNNTSTFPQKMPKYIANICYQTVEERRVVVYFQQNYINICASIPLNHECNRWTHNNITVCPSNYGRGFRIIGHKGFPCGRRRRPRLVLLSVCGHTHRYRWSVKFEYEHHDELLIFFG